MFQFLEGNSVWAKTNVDWEAAGSKPGPVINTGPPQRL